MGFCRSQPNSEGMIRLMSALTAASMRSLCEAIAVVATVETTASRPVRASVRESRDSKLTLTTLTSGGKEWVEVSRVRTVISKSWESMSSFRTAEPRVPDACGWSVSIWKFQLECQTYSDDSDFLVGFVRHVCSC